MTKMVADLSQVGSIKSVMALRVTAEPLLTSTHRKIMSKAKDSKSGRFVFVNEPKEIGQRFGRLEVLERVGVSKCGSIIFRCQCDCGNETRTWAITLHNGTAKSCGCLNREHQLRAVTTHGHSINGKTSREYTSWVGMRNRCENVNLPEWKYYGARGIKVCERWQKFKNFLDDMGERPPNTTLDRYPNQNGDYEKSNCRWATPRQQSNNVRSNVLIEFRGETKTVAQWTRITGLKRITILGRLGRGWSVEKALTTPLPEQFRKATHG